MALTFFWRCEGTTLDGTHDYTAGDTTASLSNVTVSATADRVGTNGLLSAASTNAAATFSPTGIVANATNPATLVGSAAFSVQFKTAVSGNQQVTGFRISGTSTSDAIAVETTTGQEMSLLIRDAASNVTRITTTGVNLVVDAWYGVVVRWDIANNKRAIEVYNASNVLIESVEDTATDLSPYELDTNIATLAFGNRSASHTNDVWFDNCFVADTYDEPLQNNLTITSYTSYAGTVRFVKILAPAAAALATGIEGVVLNAARDTVIGEFTGKAFEGDLEGGNAVLLISTADIVPDGTTLTTSDAPLVVAYNTTYSTDLAAATVIEV